MLDKCFFACFVLTFTGNVASDISLDYYFGLEDTLRSAKYLENCNSDRTDESCRERCGANYACLLGKCFCVNMTPQVKDADHASEVARVDYKCEKLLSKLRVLDKKLDKARTYTRYPIKLPIQDSSILEESKSEESSLLDEILRKLRPNNADETKLPSDNSEELNSKEKNLLDAFLGKARTNDGDESEASNDSDSSEELISEESNPKFNKLEELALRPTLRHHIAHFCPNLDIARKCIHKCMKRRRPAFCGKDHVCYCGHKYGSPKDKIQDGEDTYGQFQDLYEKYFGPKPHPGQEAQDVIFVQTTQDPLNASTPVQNSERNRSPSTTKSKPRGIFIPGSMEENSDFHNMSNETHITYWSGADFTTSMNPYVTE